MMQKNNRELEIIIQECILNTLRESIPVETILKAYLDETTEEDVIEEIKEEVTHEPIVVPEEELQKNHTENHTENTDINSMSNENTDMNSMSNENTNISFNDIDYVQTDDGISQVNAPKNIERLEEISNMRHEQRKLAEEEDDDDNVKINISDENYSLNELDVHNLEEPKLETIPDLIIDDIEILE